MDLKHLPPPLNKESYHLFKNGIYDSKEVNVYINEMNDFEFLYPIPKKNYNKYVPRVKKLGLVNQNLKDKFIENRFLKIKNFFVDKLEILKIGSSDSAFLKKIKDKFPQSYCTACEPDQLTLDIRKVNADKRYKNIDDVYKNKKKYDIICFFHVFEHIEFPGKFLKSLEGLMKNDSLIIIEVPSIDDPLLSLYKDENYKSFYFQNQHPFIYSYQSLNRVMNYNGFKTIEIIPHQRYGLENHLQWLSNGKPGGNPNYITLTESIESKYLTNIEKTKLTDSVIWIGEKVVKE